MSRRPNVLLLSGPNHDQFGTRDPAVYGTSTLADLVGRARNAAESAGATLEDLQSASEAELVKAIHDARGRCDAIVINAGAFTHYAWAIHDALQIYDGVVVELHMSNVTTREPWRHTSVVAPVADGLIAGFGELGYEMAVTAALQIAHKT